MPRISVVMAVFNGERYLPDAVESVLAQTCGDFEFLIVDDGSTDSTADILRSYSDPRIRVLRNARNLGLARSLNRGLRRASGEFIARQDADDLSEHRRFERQLAFLDGHPEVALVGTQAVLIDGRGEIAGKIQLPCRPLDVRWALFFHCPFVHSAVMLRRALVLDTVGDYDEAFSYSMDYDLWRRIACLYWAANLEECLVRYRVHDTSMTATYGGASGEGRRLRADEIGRLLGWKDAEAEEKETGREAMTALYFGWESGIRPHRLLQAADDLLRLQALFSEREGMTHEEAARHRGELRARIGRHLVLLARTSAFASLGQRRELLRRAYQLHRSIYLQPRVLLRTGIAVVKGVLPQASPSRAGAATPG